MNQSRCTYNVKGMMLSCIRSTRPRNQRVSQRDPCGLPVCAGLFPDGTGHYPLYAPCVQIAIALYVQRETIVNEIEWGSIVFEGVGA